MPCYPVCRLLPTFVHRGFPYTPSVTPLPRIPLVWFPSSRPVASPPPFPLGTTYGACAAMPIQMCLILVAPHHEPLGCFKDPPVAHPRIFRCSRPQRGLNSKNQGGVFRSPAFDASELPMSSTMHLCQLLKCPTGLGVSPPAIVPNTT